MSLSLGSRAVTNATLHGGGGLIEHAFERLRADAIDVVGEQSDFRDAAFGDVVAEVGRDHDDAFVEPVAHFVDGAARIVLEGDVDGLRSRLQREQLFDDAARIESVILLDDDDRQMLELALERIADDHEINDRHQDDGDQRDRIARQLLQVAAHDCEEFEPEHRELLSAAAASRRRRTS